MCYLRADVGAVAPEPLEERRKGGRDDRVSESVGEISPTILLKGDPLNQICSMPMSWLH